MYAKILSPLLPAAALAFLYASPAAAEETKACSGTLELGLSQGYTEPNYGVNVAPDEAVAQSMLAVTCHHVTARWVNVTELSSKNTNSRSHLANEQRFGLGYAHGVHTPVGTVQLNASLDYRAIDLGKGLDVSRDDYIEGAVSAALPITRGPWTLTPSLSLRKDVPIKSNNGLNFKEVGLRLDGPFLGDSRFYTDCKSIRNENSTTAVLHKNVWFCEAGMSKQIKYGWTGTMGVTFTQYGQQDIRFIHKIERGGRLTPYRRIGEMPEHPEFNPFLRFQRAF